LISHPPTTDAEIASAVTPITISFVAIGAAYLNGPKSALDPKRPAMNVGFQSTDLIHSNRMS
jgi:hypothetical protein